MRILDLSVAALIGFSSVAAIAAWNPYQLAQQGQLYTEQASLKDYLVTIVSSHGVAWLHRASPGSLCAALLSFSNSTLRVSAEGRDFVCSTKPSNSVSESSLTLEFPEGNLTLLAWQLAGQ